jgi:hypothetical protein
VCVLAVVAMVGLVVAGCGGSNADDTPPSWVPDELAGLTIRPSGVGEPSVTQQEAITTVRDDLFHGGGPSEQPDSELVRITGTVLGENEIPVAPSGDSSLPSVDDKLAWFVVWRGYEERSFMSGVSGASNDIVDFVAIVDGETGEILARLFLHGGNRLG